MTEQKVYSVRNDYHIIAYASGNLEDITRYYKNQKGYTDVTVTPLDIKHITAKMARDRAAIEEEIEGLESELAFLRNSLKRMP